MPSSPYAGRTRFGLLPEPESNPASFVTSCIINGVIITAAIAFGTVVHHDMEAKRMETTTITFPVKPPDPPPPVKIQQPKMPPPPKQEVKLQQPKINTPKIEPKPEVKMPVVKEAPALPKVAAAKPQVVLAPQPKAALAQAAAPALTPQQKPSTAPVHFGEMQGATPNPNATRPATVAAIGNPYGGNQGPAAAPRGVVASTGFGNGTKSGSNAGVQGKVASAGLPGGTGTANTGAAGPQGRVASAGIAAASAPAMKPAAAAAPAEAKTTPPVLLSGAKPSYTPEATQLKIQGDVVLRVTITTSGQVVVHGVIHGLGHGLDESAMRVAPTYKFQPATRNGQPVEFTTNIIIKFQTA